LGALDGLPEIDTEGVFQIRALFGAGVLGATLAALTEELAEDIAEAAAFAAGRAFLRVGAFSSAAAGILLVQEIGKIETAEAHAGAALAMRAVVRSIDAANAATG
jgi:hypothetical protein